MSAQLSYARRQVAGYAGQIADIRGGVRISRSVETVAGIPFGVAVSRGTDKDKQCLLGGAAGFLGITYRSLEREGVQGSGVITYGEKETAGIMQDGLIRVVCPTGCAPGDPVNYVDATGVLDAGAAVAGETALDNAIWDSVTAAGELGLIRITDINTTAGS